MSRVIQSRQKCMAIFHYHLANRCMSPTDQTSKTDRRQPKQMNKRGNYHSPMADHSDRFAGVTTCQCFAPRRRSSQNSLRGFRPRNAIHRPVQA